MNEQDKQISSLTIEALYTVTAMELEQMKRIIESDEELKAKFEEVKGSN